MNEFEIYSEGLCFMSVCTSLSVEDATTRLNSERPTGIDSKWRLSNESFKTGEANPHPCEDKPDTHKHYLFDC